MLNQHHIYSIWLELQRQVWERRGEIEYFYSLSGISPSYPHRFFQGQKMSKWTWPWGKFPSVLSHSCTSCCCHFYFVSRTELEGYGKHRMRVVSIDDLQTKLLVLVSLMRLIIITQSRVWFTNQILTLWAITYGDKAGS